LPLVEKSTLRKKDRSSAGLLASGGFFDYNTLLKRQKIWRPHGTEPMKDGGRLYERRT
jgi:hypothetical protein